MFDPFYFYDKELCNDYIAREYGFENFEDYLNSDEEIEELEARLEL